MGGNKTEAEPFAALTGAQVLAIDLPGHGERKDMAGFNPWTAAPELRTVMDYMRTRWRAISLRANSIGAWFSMLAFQSEPLENALFVSPILDMEQLIGRMMQWAGVIEAELEARETIETSFGETLSWRYYQYAKAHPIGSWPWPTAILYAGQDNLTPRQEVDGFVERFSCDLTVMEDGEHWFHTPEQLEVLHRWEQSHTAS